MGRMVEKKSANEPTARTRVVGVRMDPKLRYLAELAARKQRRSLSSFIEWATEESLKEILLRDDPAGYSTSVADAAEDLWDVDEADRFARLALRYPELLTHDEQIAWKLVRENGFVWRGRYVDSQWAWTVNENSLDFGRLRQHWDIFLAVARGDMPPNALPSWEKEETTNGDLPF